jgi:predicted enzyme related to lactoylglutathione lyase
MANRWCGVTVDCADAERLATFWSALLGRARSDEMDEPGWATVGSRQDPEPRITFQQVPEPNAAKVRLHLDIAVDDIAAGIIEVERLGGGSTGERHDYDEGVVVVMTDPEGHEFCLVEYYC